MAPRDVTPPDPDFQARCHAAFAAQGFMAHIGALLTELAPGFARIDLPHAEMLSQHDGYFHGGAIGTLADNVGGFAAMTLLPADRGILTVEYKVNILAPGLGERLIARGEVVKAGRTLIVARAEIVSLRDGVEHPCAVAQQTLMTLPLRPDAK